MTIADLQIWVEQNPLYALMGVVLLNVALFFVARGVIARGLIYLAKRTESKYDDIIVNSLRPFRVIWLVPLTVLYVFVRLFPISYYALVGTIALLLIIWVVAFTLNALLNALNEIYESSPGFSGVSIQSYLDLVKLLVIIIALILSVSLVIDESPMVLLSGLGAVMAILLLVFRDTILSLVASIQITTNDLIKEGDWIEVPGYGADGDVLNISLHTIKVQNFDKTITVIPTYKMVQEAYRNWRGMQESGGRRIKRSIYIDLGSIRFCDRDMLVRFQDVELVKNYVADKMQELADSEVEEGVGEATQGYQLTNMSIFRTYTEAYLRSHEGLHKDTMTLVVRELAPGPTGLPLEIYVFTQTTAWVEYERIQAEVLEHLLAAASFFDLRVFQEPSGMDITALADSIRASDLARS
jgi:miniconductance mechanosensitive channel